METPCNEAKARSEPPTPAGCRPWRRRDADLTRQVAEVIRKQVALGVSCVGDGEFWNGRNFPYYATAIRRA